MVVSIGERDFGSSEFVVLCFDLRFVQQVDGKVTKLQLSSSDSDGDSAGDHSARTIDM